MTDSEICERVIAIIANEARVDPDRLTRDTRLSELSIASLDVVQVLFGIEDAFDIYIPQEEQDLRQATIGQVVEGVTKLIAAK